MTKENQPCYRCAQFDPRPQGEEKNNALIGEGPVLGIEMTIPALAEQCTLGNLDHHGSNDTAETPSAAEQALTAKLPAVGTLLAIVRPDADSITAMAVLTLRLAGRTDIKEVLIRRIGDFDRLGPSAGRPTNDVIAIARMAGDSKIPLSERVKWVADVITGKVDPAEINELVSARDVEFKAAEEASQLELAADGRIAVVKSTHRFATNLGYATAPIVVAMNPEMPVDFRDSSKGTYVKYTVCRYDSHVPVDLPAALKKLQSLEPGWGGRGDIFGSPQGVSSQLSMEEVVAIIEKHLKPLK